MGMSLGPTGRQKAEINLTPMIDVLLVLIIIFLVITPVPPRGLNALIPQSSATDSPPISDIVITVLGDGNVRLNQERLDLSELQDRLQMLFRNAATRVVFLRAEKDVDFGRVAQVMDLARGLGIYRIGLMTE